MSEIEKNTEIDKKVKDSLLAGGDLRDLFSGEYLMDMCLKGRLDLQKVSDLEAIHYPLYPERSEVLRIAKAGGVPEKKMDLLSYNYLRDMCANVNAYVLGKMDAVKELYKPFVRRSISVFLSGPNAEDSALVKDMRERGYMAEGNVLSAGDLELLNRLEEQVYECCYLYAVDTRLFGMISKESLGNGGPIEFNVPIDFGTGRNEILRYFSNDWLYLRSVIIMGLTEPVGRVGWFLKEYISPLLSRGSYSDIYADYCKIK